MGAFSFITLYRTNKVSKSHSNMLGWGNICGGIVKMCSSRARAYLKWANSKIYSIELSSLSIRVESSESSESSVRM